MYPSGSRRASPLEKPSLEGEREPHFNSPPMLRELWPQCSRYESHDHFIDRDIPTEIEAALKKPSDINDVLYNRSLLGSNLEFERACHECGHRNHYQYILRRDPNTVFKTWLSDEATLERLDELLKSVQSHVEPWDRSFLDLSQDLELNALLARSLAQGALANPANHTLKSPTQSLSLGTLNTETDGGFYALGYFWIHTLPVEENAPLLPSSTRIVRDFNIPFDPDEEPRLMPKSRLPSLMSLSLEPGSCLYATLLHFNATHAWRLGGSYTHPAITHLPLVTKEPSYYSGWSALKRQQFLPYYLRFTDCSEAEAWCPPLLLMRRGQAGIDLQRANPADFMQNLANRAYGMKKEKTCVGLEGKKGQEEKVWMTLRQREGKTEVIIRKGL